MMSPVRLEIMLPSDWAEVGRLIFDSTNQWYQSQRGFSIFQGPPEATEVFCQVYEAIDPGCCLIARSEEDRRIVGSCFYHPREQHFSLGIMNVHPSAFGQGIARTLLSRVLELADHQQRPVRLVSSAMNLDSFSLYTRAGFVPRQLYQDFLLNIPPAGMSAIDASFQPNSQFRAATLQDVAPMGSLERRLTGIRRDVDYRHFIKNEMGIWHCWVLEESPGKLRGWIASVAHPASNMIGPGVAEDEEVAAELLKGAIDARRGQAMVFLVPADRGGLVKSAYQWGARNCELHVLQVHGAYQPIAGVSLPTFLPETA